MPEEPQKASSSSLHQPSSDKKPEDAEIKPQDPDHGVSPKYPVLYPGLVSGLYDEHTNRGAGIYAVPVHQFGGHVAGVSSNYLIPLTYNVPTYQTGALAPFIRWLSQGMHRAAVPPPPRAPRPDNDPAAAMPLNQDAVPEGQENEAGDGRANANENVGAGQQGNQWWGIVKEIQMIVFGFITSLLPGFHNID